MSGTIELQSSSYLTASSGRPEFQIRMKHGWNGLQKYHVVALNNGLLMLNIGATVAATGQFDGTLGFVGGLLGGKLGRVLGDAFAKASESTLAMADSDFSMCSDDELIQKARTREHKGSLVAAYDEIEAISIDPCGTASAWTRGGAVAALITVRETTLGKMTWEMCDLQSLLVASEFLPAKFGDKVSCNIEYDRESLKFVPRNSQSS